VTARISEPARRLDCLVGETDARGGGTASETDVRGGAGGGPVSTAVVPGNSGLPETSGYGDMTVSGVPTGTHKPSTVPTYITAAEGPTGGGVGVGCWCRGGGCVGFDDDVDVGGVCVSRTACVYGVMSRGWRTLVFCFAII
jgi:hypothetical protein